MKHYEGGQKGTGGIDRKGEGSKGEKGGKGARKGGRIGRGECALYPGWNLKYRASRTPTLAPETRETRRRGAARRAGLTRAEERHLEIELGRRVSARHRLLKSFPPGIGWNFQQVKKKKWKFRYAPFLRHSELRAGIGESPTGDFSLSLCLIHVCRACRMSAEIPKRTQPL